MERQSDSQKKYAEGVNAAAWIWQNCLFWDSATSSIFSHPGCLWKNFAYSWPACFENLSLSLFYLLRTASEPKTLHQTQRRPADTVGQQHWQPTESGLANEPDIKHHWREGRGGGGVTFCHCLSIHSFIHIGRKHTCPHQKDNTPHILPLLNTHTLSQNSPCIHPLLSFGWVKSSKTPALCMTCLPPQLQESERGKEELVSTGQHFSDKSNYGFMT